MRRAFQSPYGGRGRSDREEAAMDEVLDKLRFQSPYGGRGRSDEHFTVHQRT